MKKFLYIIIYCTIAAVAVPDAMAENNVVTTSKRERNYIKEGNSLYKDGRYAEAEIAYKKALQENASNEIALFNLASTYIKQAGADNGNALLASADSIMRNLVSQAQDISIAEKSFYNLGNMAYNKEDYKGSIDMYKNVLRRNPDNNQARENLRMAQLKLQQQQQDQNKDNKQNQDKNQQDQQDQQDQQNKDQQNKDQNKDNEQNKDKDQQDKDQQNNQNRNQNQSPENKEQQQNGGISDENAEKILKAMENEENATRRRVDVQKSNEEKRNASQRNIEKPW